MSILDTLVIDRTEQDVERLKAILQNGLPNMTPDEYQYFFRGELENLEDSTDDDLTDANGLTIQCRDGVLPKGAYNYQDLNRVIEAVEYVTELIRSADYDIESPQKIAIVRNWEDENNKVKNRVRNPTFTNGMALTDWTATNTTYYTSTPGITDDIDFVAIEKIYAYSTVDTRVALYSTLNYSTSEKGGLYYIGCRYLSGASNNGTITLRLHLNGAATESVDVQLPDIRDEIQDFHILYQAPQGQRIYRISICINNSVYAKGSIYYVSRPFVYNLSVMYGNGEEPDLEWCVDHLGHSALLSLGDVFNTRDIPTEEQMEIYLESVERVRDRLPLVNVRYDSIPSVPADMERLLPNEANDIEKILPLISDTVERIEAERLAFFSGELYGGEV